jgi:malate synthase
MAAQIPIKDDALRNAVALDKVRADKEREATDGHDGTWVAHPALVPVARAAFDAIMTGEHQLARLRDDVSVAADDLLAVPAGDVTAEGLRLNLRVGVQYLSAWLAGNGCVPLYDLMEDAATAEISRAQVWQWLRHGARLADGRPVERAVVAALLADELERLRADASTAGPRFALAADLFERLVLSDELADFLTLGAYEHL